MSSLVRISLKRFLCNNNTKLFNEGKNLTLVRTITSRTTRSAQDRPPKPKPWPYQEKGYTLFHYLYDKTTPRLDENSKIIVVDGPVASGKSKFAKELATELEMLYLPEANLDMIYINSYGYDLKKLDPLMPESCRTHDVMNFLKNPKHRNTARFQIQQYIVRFSQYIDALAHVLSTGEGVILDRCVYSDFVFAEAMYSQGYLSKAARKKYYEIRDNTIHELLRPHLVIYLDVPVPKVMENIKKRAISYEKDSAVLTPQYLAEIEKQYKQNYLKEISKHADMLIYDWSNEGDIEIVVEDIERIDFNRFDIQDSQMKDWVYRLEEEWGCLRYKYADKKEKLMNYCNVPCYEVPELIVEALDAGKYYRLLEEAPGQRYQKGYNTNMGDSGYLFKTSIPHRQTLPLRERRIES
ncbi:NADH dehydrogenase (ubiquinone) subunit ND-42 [Leptinotarsa decemlineata]|uniref:NADH dehydrogenase (ubiquinone) subunit ND-42 n=1 Tax=Leptinotarsa decemlineata TaxID=7539 RepID=UPI003D306F82